MRRSVPCSNHLKTELSQPSYGFLSARTRSAFYSGRAFLYELIRGRIGLVFTGVRRTSRSADFDFPHSSMTRARSVIHLSPINADFIWSYDCIARPLRKRPLSPQLRSAVITQTFSSPLKVCFVISIYSINVVHSDILFRVSRGDCTLN